MAAASFAFSACDANVLKPQGPIAPTRIDPDRLARDHAGHRLAHDRGHARVRVVVPRLQHHGALSADWAYSGRIEFVVWAIPALVVFFLGGVAWISSHQLDPAEPIPSTTPLEVQVVSLDWKWLFIYPEQQVASRQQARRAGRHARAFLADLGERDECVFHPAARQHDLHHERHDDPAQPAGRRAGTFHGLSAHFSGDGFSGMDFEVHAVPAERLLELGAGRRARSDAVLDAQLCELAKQTIEVSPATFRLGDPDLFEAIATPEAAARPGPAGARRL